MLSSVNCDGPNQAPAYTAFSFLKLELHRGRKLSSRSATFGTHGAKSKSNVVNSSPTYH